MFPSVLADPSRQAALASEGWVTLPSIGGALATLQQIHARARAMLASDELREERGYYELMQSSGVEHRRAVQRELEAALAQYVTDHIPGARLVVSNILLKDPNAQASEVGLHQDFAIVDEAAGQACLQLWIPFVDVLDAPAGGLAFVPKSHLARHPYRAPGDATPFARFMAQVTPLAVRPPLRAGDPVAFWASTVHGSPPNLLPHERPALACMLIPKDAELVHYIRRSPTEVERWTMSDEDLRNMLPGAPPASGRRVEQIVHADPTLDEAAFDTWRSSTEPRAAVVARAIDSRVLFLHPYNHMEGDAVPVGAVGLVNLLPGKALGRFASEVTLDELRAARVVLIDVHWFFPLGILEGLVRAIRSANPRVKVVVGGLASAFYAEIFFERYAVDFVTTGDVEPVFPTLIGHLLADEEPPPLPGVWAASAPGRPPPPGDRIRAAEFDAIDWLTIDWFPSYRDAMYAIHATYRSQLGDSVPLSYPYLLVTRGCRRACSFCYGAYHERVFGRGIRMRDPEILLRDLRAIEADPGLSFVSILFTDEGLMAPYAPILAGKQLKLDAFLYFCGNADPEVLEQVRSGFAGAVSFSIVQAPDLAPLASDPAPEVQAERLRALVERIDGMARTGARIYQNARAGRRGGHGAGPRRLVDPIRLGDRLGGDSSRPRRAPRHHPRRAP